MLVDDWPSVIANVVHEYVMVLKIFTSAFNPATVLYFADVIINYHLRWWFINYRVFRSRGNCSFLGWFLEKFLGCCLEIQLTHEEEKDLLGSISALKSAVTVLSKHNSLLQMPQSHISGIAASVQNVMQRHSSLLEGVLTRTQRKAVSAFVQAPADYFDAEPTFKQSYAPQSGAIFGILSQMKETFETNLSASQKEEMSNQKVADFVVELSEISDNWRDVLEGRMWQ
jgi:hypothetical protein